MANKDEKSATVAPASAPWRLFLSSTTTYTQANAYNCALLSTLAYASGTIVEKFFAQAKAGKDRNFTYDSPAVQGSPFFGVGDHFICTSKVDFHDDTATSTQFFFARNSRQVIVSIRGTQEKPWDVLQDAKIKKVKYPYALGNRNHGEVHMGFYQAFEAVRAKLDPYIKDNGCSNSEFFVTGHSLGGAVATLVATYLRFNQRIAKVSLHTYGSPRVGDKTFAEGVKDLNYYRIVDGNDIVTMLPPPGVDFREYFAPLVPINPSIGLPLTLLDISGDPYTHCGQLVHIEASVLTASGVVQTGVRSLQPSMSESKGRTATLRDFASQMATNIVPLDALFTMLPNLAAVYHSGAAAAGDHSVAKYISLLKSLVKETANFYRGDPKSELNRLKADISALEAELLLLDASKADLLKKEVDTRQHAKDLYAEAQKHYDMMVKLAQVGASSADVAAERAAADKLRGEADATGEYATIVGQQAGTVGIIRASKYTDLLQYKLVANDYASQTLFKESSLARLIGGRTFMEKEPLMEAEIALHAK